MRWSGILEGLFVMYLAKQKGFYKNNDLNLGLDSFFQCILRIVLPWKYSFFSPSLRLVYTEECLTASSIWRIRAEEEADSSIMLYPPTGPSEIFDARGLFLSNSSRRDAKNRCVRSAFGFCTIYQKEMNA